MKSKALGQEFTGVPSLGKMIALFRATEEGNLPRIRKLIQLTGPAIRKAHSGCTLLHIAAANNQMKTVRFLLHYISPNVVNNDNQTPAHKAAMEGYNDILKILLADNDFDPNIRDIWQRTYKDWLASPLFEAVLLGNTYQTRELLELGANPDYHAGSSIECALEEEVPEVTTARQLAFALGEECIICMFPKDMNSSSEQNHTTSDASEFPTWEHPDIKNDLAIVT